MDNNKSTKSDSSKADFIRGLAGVPAKDVVAKAKEAGITLSEAYVYKLRSNERLAAKKGGAPAAAKPAAAKPAAKKAAAPKKGPAKRGPGRKAAAKPAADAPAAVAAAPKAAVSRASEEKFVDLVLDLGLSTAEELLAKVRARVKKAILA
ncbi:MAG: hypothetical protein IPK82_36960 [Polyangiaceae bacterium]|nr:hypothetical protein [Polyangiaceae bacterium]